MTAKEFRQMAPDVLEKEVDARRSDLLRMRCQVALGEEVHPHQIKERQRDIARMLTVLTEKKRASAEGDQA